MLGLALVAIGGVLLWAAFTGRADRVIHALNMNLPAGDASAPGAPGSANSGGSGGATHGNAADSGTHAGLDANGNVIQINKPYALMTPSEKDAANKFAIHIGNVGSTA